MARFFLGDEDDTSDIPVVFTFTTIGSLSSEFVDDISWRIIAGVRIRTAPKIGVIHIIIIDIDDLFAVVRYG